MADLESRMARSRRMRLMGVAAAAAFALLFAVAVWMLTRPAQAPPSLFRAQVPTAAAPLFSPASGAALAGQDGTVVISPEVRT